MLRRARHPATAEVVRRRSGATGGHSQPGISGQADDLDLLVTKLTRGSKPEQAAASQALGRLPGETVWALIAKKLSSSDPQLQQQLMQILVARRAFAQADALLPLAVGSDADVRAAAMTALSQLAGPAQIAGMVQGILAAEPGRARDAAEKAVMLVCHASRTRRNKQIRCWMR